LDYIINLENDLLIVKEKSGKYAIDLKSRTYNFSKNIIKMLMTLPYKKEFEVFRSQLSKSATSIGANYEESQASSPAEFHHRIQICLREARESHYWLRLIKDILEDQKLNPILDNLINESTEIKNIFGAISQKSRTHKYKK